METGERPPGPRRAPWGSCGILRGCERSRARPWPAPRSRAPPGRAPTARHLPDARAAPREPLQAPLTAAAPFHSPPGPLSPGGARVRPERPGRAAASRYPRPAASRLRPPPAELSSRRSLASPPLASSHCRPQLPAPRAPAWRGRQRRPESGGAGPVARGRRSGLATTRLRREPPTCRPHGRPAHLSPPRPR